MKSIIAIIAVFGMALGAQADTISTGNQACDRALEGMGNAVDIVNDIGDRCDVGNRYHDGRPGCVLTESEVATWYAARKMHDQCLEVALGNCGCNGGVSCPPPSTTAVEGCKASFEESAESIKSGIEKTGKKKYHSKPVQQGVHYVEFNIPIDIFATERTKIGIEIKDDASAPIIPQFNTKGDVLYIREGSYDIHGKYKCRPTWYDSIEQANLSAEDVWDTRRTNVGAKADDKVHLKDFANCEAFANQAFTITVEFKSEAELNASQMGYTNAD